MTALAVTSRSAGLAVALLAVLLGLGLKGHRYAGRFSDHTAADQLRLSGFLGKAGWLPAETAITGLPFAALTFVKAGCPAPLIVASLGTTLELADDVRMALGEDVAFLQDGEPVRDPALFGSQLGDLTRSLRTADEAPGTLHLLAVAPAPRTAAAVCAPPPLASWKDF